MEKRWRCRVEYEEGGVYARNRFMAVMRFARRMAKLLRKPAEGLVECWVEEGDS